MDGPGARPPLPSPRMRSQRSGLGSRAASLYGVDSGDAAPPPSAPSVSRINRLTVSKEQRTRTVRSFQGSSSSRVGRDTRREVFHSEGGLPRRRGQGRAPLRVSNVVVFGVSAPGNATVTSPRMPRHRPATAPPSGTNVTARPPGTPFEPPTSNPTRRSHDSSARTNRRPLRERTPVRVRLTGPMTFQPALTDTSTSRSTPAASSSPGISCRIWCRWRTPPCPSAP